MSDTALVRHVACPACQEAGRDHSGDNAAEYEDGSIKCHACGFKSTDVGANGGGGDVGSLSSAVPTSDQLHPEVKELRGRNLSQATCDRYGYGVVEFHGQRWQAAPYRDATGRPVAWKLRSKDKKFQWVGNPAAGLPLFGQHLQSNGRRIVVTEGECDALAVSQALDNRWPAVSVPNGAGHAKAAIVEALGWLSGYDQIVLCLDNDEAGREATDECVRLLPPGKAYVCTLPLKDAGEMVRLGRTRELKSLLWNAPLWAPSGLLEGKDLLRAIQGKYKPPFAQYPFPRLQSMTGGMRHGEIILIASTSGAGKSTLCRTLTHHLVTHGIKVGVLSLEETVDQYMVPLVGYSMGKNLRLAEEDPTSDEDFVDAFNAISENLVGYDDDGNRDPDAIFDRLRYMTLGFGCEVIVVDHLTVVLGASAKNSLEFTDRFMSNLEALVKRTRATVLLVTHLRKSGGQGGTHAEGKRVSMDDVRGSGLISALSHTIIARERDQQSMEDGTLRLLKCRLSGTGELGECDSLRFNKGTGMIETGDDPAALLQTVDTGGKDY